MTEQLSIASLINRQPSGQTESSGAGDLPHALQQSQALWAGLAKRLSVELTELLETDTTVDIALSMEAELSLRVRFPEPGILIPADVPVKESFYLIPRDGAKTLATLLLRSSSTSADKDVTASDQDGLLISEVLGKLSDLAQTAFGRPLSLEPKTRPLTDWPLQAPSPQNRLVVQITLGFNTMSDCDIYFAFGDDQVRDFERILDQSADQIQPHQIYLPISGILSRWHADQVEIAAISPGDRLVIPGGHLEDVMVEIDTSDANLHLARAELGTTRGRHALKVKSSALIP